MMKWFGKDDSNTGQRRQRILTYNQVIGWLLVVVAVVAFAQYAVTGPIYSRLKRWHARQFVSRARALVEAGKWQEALHQAQLAQQLTPYDPPVLRTIARIAGHYNDPICVQYWQTFVQTPAATRADRLACGEAALRYGRIALAGQQVKALLKSPQAGVRTLSLASAYYQQRGDTDRAIRLLRRAINEKSPGTARPLLLANLELSSRSATNRLQGKALLWQIETNTGPLGLEAVRRLVTLPLTANETERLYNLMRQRKDLSVTDRFHLLDLRWRLQPKQRSALIDQAIREYSTGKADVLAQLGAWLNSKRAFARTLKWIPESKSLKDGALLLVRLGALAGLGQWQDVRHLLDRGQSLLTPVVWEGYVAQCESQLDHPSAADSHWDLAFQKAGKDPALIEYLAGFAERIGSTARAIDAYRLLTGFDTTAPIAYRHLVTLLHSQGDARPIRAAFTHLIQWVPDDPALRNGMAYYDLLLKKDVSEAARTASELARRFPDDLGPATTLALARFQQADYPGALQVYRGRSLTWDGAEPSWLAVYVCVLEANGRSAELEALASRQPYRALFTSTALLRQEKQLFVKAVGVNPKPLLSDRFVVRDLKLELGLAPRDQVIQDAIDSCSGGNLETATALSEWLLKQGEYARILDYLTLKLAKKTPALFSVYLNALANLGRWSDIALAMNEHQPAVDPVKGASYHAMVAYHIGQQRAASLWWKRALKQAGRNPEELLFIARYAEKFGDADTARIAYGALARIPKYALMASQNLVRLLQGTRDTIAFRDALARWAALQTGNVAVQNALAYYNLLLRTNIPEARAVAERLLKEYPEDVAPRVTLMLADLRTNQPRAALALWAKHPMDWDHAKPGWVAIYAAVQATNGQVKAATALAKTIDQHRLRPEEKTLIADLLKKKSPFSNLTQH